MSKRFFSIFTIMIVALVAIFAPVKAEQVSANEQDVMFEIKEAGGGSTSIADGYFVKPGKLTVEDGKNFVQMSLKDADYVKSLSGPYGPVEVISDEGKKRVVKMQVGDITKPVELQMHVVVPEEVAGMDYDHKHKAILQFNTDGVDVASLGTTDDQQETPAATTDGDKKDDNPKTSDTTPFMMYAVLIIGSVVTMYILWKRRPAND